MVYGSAGMLLLFLAVSLFSFILFLEILRHFYEKICNLLQSGEAGRNYKMQNLSAKSVRNVLTVFIVSAVVGLLPLAAIIYFSQIPTVVIYAVFVILLSVFACIPYTAPKRA